MAHARETGTWQALERAVRITAEAKFSTTARAEDIAGVKCDCVLHLDDSSVVIIEISKEQSIDKLRTDLAKFNVIRPHFFGQSIFPRCYFVTDGNPTPALIAAGTASHVRVLSAAQLLNLFLGSTDYLSLRSHKAFGSAINLYSGEPDEEKYVGVSYVADSGEEFNTADLAAQLLRGRSFVLMGDYGTGKSRCVKEVFDLLRDGFKAHFHTPLAINLRENWGLNRSTEILTRHFTELGLEQRVGPFLKVAYVPGNIYLLDGFDEIGAQTWSDDPSKLVDIRKRSLVAVKDLIAKSRGGLLITGREHYFNNDVEMMECLGLTNKNVTILRCQQELNESQFNELVGEPLGSLPPWLPRKPLIGIIIRDIDPGVVRQILKTSSGQVDFWDLLLQTFCEREANINPILDPLVIRALYAQIGRISRTTTSMLGPISIKQITEAFERTTGRPPTDESAIILQRLPGLSRIGAESLDRQFVDTFILDGLKAEDLLAIYSEADHVPLFETWVNPCEDFGSFFLASKISDLQQQSGLLAYIKRHWSANNRILLSDMISALFRCDGSTSSFGGLRFKGGKFFHLGFGDAKVAHLILDDCSFDSVDLTDAEPNDIVLTGCTIDRISGAASEDNLPSWVQDSLVEEFQNVETLAGIRSAGLSIAQTFLLSSLRKLFLQPGGGRKHSSMYKGYGDSAAKKTCDRVISLLVRKGFCKKIQGTSEALYIPDRSLTARAKLIVKQMSQSKDEVWTQASQIS